MGTLRHESRRSPFGHQLNGPSINVDVLIVSGPTRVFFRRHEQHEHRDDMVSDSSGRCRSSFIAILFTYAQFTWFAVLKSKLDDLVVVCILTMCDVNNAGRMG